jgi:hypothetical protein
VRSKRFHTPDGHADDEKHGLAENEEEAERNDKRQHK